jgi:hypothetical protein
MALIEDPLEVQLEQDWCKELHPELKRAIASGSMMTGVKRAVSVPGSIPVPGPGWPAMDLTRENAALRFTIDAMRNSTSWRITAPLRALRRRLRGWTGGN